MKAYKNLYRQQTPQITPVQTIPKANTMEDVQKSDRRKGREGDLRVI